MEQKRHSPMNFYTRPVFTLEKRKGHLGSSLRPQLGPTQSQRSMTLAYNSDASAIQQSDFNLLEPMSMCELACLRRPPVSHPLPGLPSRDLQWAHGFVGAGSLAH